MPGRRKEVIQNTMRFKKAVELEASLTRLGHGICQHKSDAKSMIRHRWAAADTKYGVALNRSHID
jgi:hypothetical protein